MTNDTDMRDMECIEPFTVAPWQSRADVRIQGRETAIEMAKKAIPELTIFTDASDKNGVVGIGVTHLARYGTTCISKTVRNSGTVSVHTAELMAIKEACRLVNGLWPGHGIYRGLTVTIYSDSQSALQALAKPRQQSGQSHLREITNLVTSLKERWAPRLIFRWVPGHSGVRGNEQAHQAAR